MNPADPHRRWIDWDKVRKARKKRLADRAAKIERWLAEHKAGAQIAKPGG